MNFEEFGAEKAKIAAGDPSRLLSGSLPQLTLPGGKVYGQSGAIVKYALASAKARGSDAAFQLGSDDPEDILAIEGENLQLSHLALAIIHPRRSSAPQNSVSTRRRC